MRGLGLRYVQFLLALVLGCVAAGMGAMPALLAVGMPGTNWVSLGMLLPGLVPGTLFGVVAFWALGRRAPLRAGFHDAALAGAAAALLLLALLRLAARVPWLSGDDAVLATLAAMATLGFLPFARPGPRPEAA